MAEWKGAAPQGERDPGTEGTRGGRHLQPRVDVFETEHELTVVAEMPGVRCEDIDVRFERGELTLHGKRTVQPRPYLVQEAAAGDFFRAFQIREPVDGGRIEAVCKNGLLSVRLPKAGAAPPRQVHVRGG